MSETLLFKLGADVTCTDGECGRVRLLVIHPDHDVVTHLMVEPAHRQGLGKLVPLRLVDTTLGYSAGGEVRLSCSMAEFGQLDPADARYFFPGNTEFEFYGGEPMVSWPYFAPQGVMLPDAPGYPGVAQVVTVDTVTDQLPGEDEVSPGQHVHAKDGDIGHLRGIVVEPGTGRVISVLLREGHLLSHRDVLIPRSAVTEVSADGFHLGITRQQVKDLPPADTEHA